jgi:hypothetical protein
VIAHLDYLDGLDGLWDIVGHGSQEGSIGC